MIYEIKNGKLVNAEVPDNHRINNLQNGTMVKYSGDMANNPTTYIIVGKRSSNYGVSYWVIDKETYRESFLDSYLLKDGRRFVVTDEIASNETVLEMFKMAEIKKAHEEEAKLNEVNRRKTLEEKYKLENPSLEVGQYHVVASRNIKKELKLKYPSVKFSVRSEGYAGGNNITVEWTDGPTVADVKKITSKYVAGNFDGMTDYYNYDRRNVWVDVFGGSKYIHVNRHYSDSHVQNAIDQMGEIDGKKYTVENYKIGNMERSHIHFLYEIMERF